MKTRIAVRLFVLAIIGCPLVLASSVWSPPSPPTAGQDWLSSHAFVAGNNAVDVRDVAQVLLGTELRYRHVHHVYENSQVLHAALIRHFCTFVFGSTRRVERALHLRGYAFSPVTSGPNASPSRPHEADHAGYAVQCSYSTDRRGTRLLDLEVSSGGLALRNLRTYAEARSHGITGQVAFSARPRGLVNARRARAYLHHRLRRVRYLSA